MNFFSLETLTELIYFDSRSFIFLSQGNRKLWDIKLNISAPQIFLVEHFADKNTVICIIDFGKLYFTNNQDATTFDQNPDHPVTQTSADMDLSEEDEGNQYFLEDNSNFVMSEFSIDFTLLDSEKFATPCSTPAASEVSDLSDSRKVSLDEISKNITNSINESNFHCQIYER